MICFLLKTNVKIRFLPVTIFEEENEPFYPIPDKEWQIEKFTLLSRVNEFVIKLYRIQITKRENESEEINSQIVFSKRTLFDFPLYLVCIFHTNRMVHHAQDKSD